jgi:DNA-binding GntR family transcriptional regulator
VTTTDNRPLSLADEAYGALRDRIVDCRLSPGLRVTERKLAAELSLGLSPVRQALARLDSEGLVRTLPRRGYQITPLTIESVNELFQLWRILGPSIVELAGRNMSAEKQTQVTVDYRAKLTAAQRAGDVSTLLGAAEELWMRLAEATGNRRLIAMYVRLVDELRRVFRLVFQDPASAGALADLAGDENWVPMEDPAKDRAYTEQYIDAAHRSVLAILTSWPSVVQAEVVPPMALFLH